LRQRFPDAVGAAIHIGGAHQRVPQQHAHADVDGGGGAAAYFEPGGP